MIDISGRPVPSLDQVKQFDRLIHSIQCEGQMMPEIILTYLGCVRQSPHMREMAGIDEFLEQHHDRPDNAMVAMDHTGLHLQEMN